MRQAINQGPDWMHYRVKLDGEWLDRCIEADDEAGYAIVFVRAEYPPGREPIVVTERREGRVELIRNPSGAER